MCWLPPPPADQIGSLKVCDLPTFCPPTTGQTFPALLVIFIQGVECDEPGATIETLHVQKGHWRAALDVIFIRECSSEVKTCLPQAFDAY